MFAWRVLLQLGKNAVEHSGITPSLRICSITSKNNSLQGWECRSGASFYMHEALGSTSHTNMGHGGKWLSQDLGGR